MKKIIILLLLILMSGCQSADSSSNDVRKVRLTDKEPSFTYLLGDNHFTSERLITKEFEVKIQHKAALDLNFTSFIEILSDENKSHAYIKVEIDDEVVYDGKIRYVNVNQITTTLNADQQKQSVVHYRITPYLKDVREEVPYWIYCYWWVDENSRTSLVPTSDYLILGAIVISAVVVGVMLKKKSVK